MKGKKSIAGVNLLCWVATILIVGICFLIFFTYQRQVDFKRNERLLKLVQERMIDDFLEDKLIAASNSFKQKFLNSPAPIPEKFEINNNTHNLCLQDVYIFNQNYETIYSPEKGVFTVLLSGKDRERLIAELRKKVFSGYSVPGECFLETSKGQKYRVKWRAAKVQDSPFTMLVAKNMRSIDEAILGNINRMKIDMLLDLLYIFLLMILVILVAIRFAYLIAKEIKAEVNSLIYLCDSGLKIQPDKVSESYSYEEFSIISKAIRTMSEQISGLLIELKSAAVKSSTARQIQSGFLSSITHNLIGKLNNIMGIAQIIREKEVAKVGHDEPETDLFKLSDSIINSGKAINTLLRDVNYIVALDTEDFSPKKELFNLDDFQKDVSKGLGISSFSIKNFSFLKSGEIPKQIKSDRNLLKLIITNILEICGTALRNKDVSISFSFLAEKKSEDKTELEIRILIPQVGLTQSQLDELENFPFVPRQYAALGLRMAIARRLTEMIGGSLKVKLQNHSDLDVVVLIPVELSESMDIIQSQEKELSKLSLKVLAVDDDAGSRQVIMLMLKSIGIDVYVVDSGAEALKLLKKRNDFDIVLMDCEMPDLNGYDTVIELRRFENEMPDFPHIPVIAMTGYTTPEDERRCLESGMDLFLPKPLMIEDLKNAILTVLNKKKTSKES